MGAIVPRRPIEEADRMLAQNYEGACIFTKKALAIVGVGDDIVAVRHDLPHMPSLGVSSLDSRPPCRHGGLLFLRWTPSAKPRSNTPGDGGYPDQVPVAVLRPRSLKTFRVRQMTPRPMRS
jgi:hypothetical protein